MAVGIEDVDVIEFHAAQALVEARCEVFARSPVAVGSRPHVVTRFGRDEHFVAVGAERAFHQTAEILLGRAVRRPVVVRKVEMGDSAVEGVMGHPLHVGEGLPAAEIVPHTQRKGRQQHAAAPGAPVDHTVVVTVGRRLIG